MQGTTSRLWNQKLIHLFNVIKFIIEKHSVINLLLFIMSKRKLKLWISGIRNSFYGIKEQLFDTNARHDFSSLKSNINVPIQSNFDIEKHSKLLNLYIHTLIYKEENLKTNFCKEFLLWQKRASF